MDETGARYEFRAFAHDFGIVEKTLRRHARVACYRESLEVYIMSAGNDENSTKVRGGVMDNLDDHENVNYLLAVKRVIGMAPLPDGAFYRAC